MNVPRKLLLRKYFSRKAILSGLALTAGLAFLPAAQAQTLAPSFTFSTNYVYTGGLQTFVDPIGTTSIFITLSGAGGGGFVFSKVGGNGALVSGFLSVTPGTTYDILVGGGGGTVIGGVGSDGGGFGGGGAGAAGNDQGFDASGGGGGGRSAFQTALGVDLADAGGGGGAGSAAGGSGGFNGGSSSDGPSGTGGTQKAGGTGANSGVGHQGGSGGQQFVGGGVELAGGGGGGGGYFGGGGGFGGAPSGGGGGGSSLLPNSTFAAVSGGGGAGGVGPSDIINQGPGSGYTPGTNGSNGLVTIQYNPSAPVPEMSSAVGLGACLLGLSLIGLRLRRKTAA